MALASHNDDSQTVRTLSLSMAGDIVELVVLTAEEGLLQTLREAVGGARRVWHVLAPDKVPDLLVAGEVGILVIDVATLRESATVFVAEIKRQFPDLVVLVAGSRHTELELTTLISTGQVYRFIHKPLSPNRARLFVEAAVRRYGERRRSSVPKPAPDRYRDGPKAWPLVAAGLAALLALIAVLFLSLRLRPETEAPATRPPAATALTGILMRAGAALAGNRLTAPPGDNALELYLQASAVAPADPSARNGLAEVRERLLARAENALLEERLDEASTAIETARRSGVEASRIAFLSAQLAKSREQLRGARARAHGAATTPPVTSSPAATATEQANAFAGLATERIAQGRLVEPANDSARHYVEQALGADPNSEAAADARQTLAARLLIEARAAMDRRDFAHATEWLQSADGIALPENIESTRSMLDTARQQAQSDALEQLLKSGSARLGEDRLIEPAGDSAKYYLLTLRGLDPQHAGLAVALDELGAKLTAKARLAFTLQQYAAARSWLDEATAVGYSSADATGIAQQLDSATAPPRRDDLLPASQLTLLKSVQPVYPPRASSARLEGWVEVDFTVAANGQVTQPAVHAAHPAGVFDEAALRAVAQWRYQPVERDGQPIAVHSRVRIRFTP